MYLLLCALVLVCSCGCGWLLVSIVVNLGTPLKMYKKDLFLDQNLVVNGIPLTILSLTTCVLNPASLGMFCVGLACPSGV